MKVTVITPQIFTRGNLHRLSQETLREEVNLLGIKGIISLVGSPIYQLKTLPFYQVYAFPDGRMTPARATRLEEIVQDACEFLKTGEKLLVNCNAGRNRSCLVVAMILVNLNGFSGREAIDFVREKRPRALANLDFEQYLLTRGK